MKKIFIVSMSLCVSLLPLFAEETKEEATYWEKTKKAYEELRSGDKNLKDETKQWIADDLERIGDWEYRVVEVEGASVDLMETKLNEMGAERWECFFVERFDSKLILYFKKNKISYLQKLSRR